VQGDSVYRTGDLLAIRVGDSQFAVIEASREVVELGEKLVWDETLDQSFFTSLTMGRMFHASVLGYYNCDATRIVKKLWELRRKGAESISPIQDGDSLLP